MRLIGRIEKNIRGEQTYYNFILEKYIDEKGKIVHLKPEDTHFISNMTGLSDAQFQNDYIRRKITLWHSLKDIDTLESLVKNNTEIEWNIELDQEHIELHSNNSGFETVKDYTFSEFEEFDNAFKVTINTEEEVYNTLRGYLDERRVYLKNKMKEYGIEPGKRSSDLCPDGKKFINRLYESSKKFSESSKKLGDTNNIDECNVDYGEIYTKADETALYMLKYSYAYRYLYMKMYQKAFELLQPEDKTYRVLAVGCGSKLDLIGLKLAANNAERVSDYSYCYYGVDAEDWTDIEGANCSLCNDEVAFDYKTIQAYLNGVDSIDADIIIFPYSLPELIDSNKSKTREEFGLPGSPSDKITPWEYICEMLPNLVSKKKFIVMTAYRDAAFDNDKNKFNELKRALEEKYENYSELTLNNGCSEKVRLYKDSNEEEIIRKLNYGEIGGKYGVSVTGTKDSIWELLADTMQSIQIETENGVDKISSQPMLYSNYINYEVVLFERVEE